MDEQSSTFSKILHQFSQLDKRLYVLILGGIAIITYAAFAFASSGSQSTNNATVRCETIDIVSEVRGILKEAYFTDNTLHTKGDLLAKIEDNILLSQVKQRETEAKLAKAAYDAAVSSGAVNNINTERDIEISKASWQEAISQSTSIEQQINQSKAEIVASKAALDQAKRNLDRDVKLAEKNLISANELDEAQLQFKVARSNYNGVVARLKSLQATLEAQKNAITVQHNTHLVKQETKDYLINETSIKIEEARQKMELAEEQLEYSRLLLSRTELKALRTGYVTNTRIFEGDFVEIGQPIASIVSCGRSAWIEANFKETQIAGITHGQHVDIKIDTYPGLTINGIVEGLSYGSGATFSVLPPENAVGNFTKVVQRFPVRIQVNNANDVDLRAGMSATVKVYTK